MGNLVFQATLGGQVNLVGPNTASTFNLNVPAVSSTIATLTGTETFTNKTLTSPTLTTPVLGTPSSGTLTNCTGLPNAGLVNSSVTVGSTAISLGGTATTVAGLTSLATNTLTSAASTALTLQSAGTTAVTIDTSQNVLVGVTTSTAGRLAVKDVAGSGNNLWLIGRSSDGTSSVSFRNNADSAYNARIECFDTGTMTFGTGASGTERMRIDSSGNVGIGTTSPQTKLQVLNEGSLNTDLDGNSSNATIVGNNKNATDNQGNLFIISNSTATDGFGGSICFGGRYTGSNTAAFARVGGVRTGGTFSGALTFYARNSSGSMPEAARIDSSGNLLVGKTAINISNLGLGFVKSGSGSNGIYMELNQSQNGTGCIYLNQSFGSGTQNFIDFRYNNSTVGSITSSGTTTAYNVTSDYRLKENIVPLTGALNKILQLKPSTYNYKSKPEENIEGFIAHELQSVVPHAVTGEKDAVDEDGKPKYQGVDASFLIPHLTAAIQELKAINDTQAETINALTARVVALEAK